jgi:hypothetical protein
MVAMTKKAQQLIAYLSPHMMEGAMMARYFQSLAQAEKHVYEQKHHPGYGKLQ